MTTTTQNAAGTPATTLVTRSTLLTFNPDHRLIRMASRDVDRLHKLVMCTHRGHLIEGVHDARRRLGILYAAQRGPATGDEPDALKALLVQSQFELDCSEIVEWGAARVQRSNIQRRTFSAGDQFRIRTWVSLARRSLVRRGTNGFGKRFAINDSSEVAAWMIRIMGQRGCDIAVPTLEVGPQRRLHGANRITVVLWPVQFTGTVTNPQPFAAAVREGVGRARAYGGGLLHLEQLTQQSR